MITLRKGLRICLSCGKKFIEKSIRQKYCGSRKEKIGCSYNVKREQSINYYGINKKRLSELGKKYRDENKDKIKLRHKLRRLKWREKNPKKEKVIRTREEKILMTRKRNKRYYYKHRKKLIRKRIQLDKEKIKNDINYKLKIRLRGRLYRALKGNYKHKKTIDLLGCSIRELKKYLEKRFQSGMTWTNYGLNGWSVDHVKPLSSFNLSNPQELEQAAHYSNLQPLWQIDNLSKGAKIFK